MQKKGIWIIIAIVAVLAVVFAILIVSGGNRTGKGQDGKSQPSDIQQDAEQDSLNEADSQQKDDASTGDVSGTGSGLVLGNLDNEPVVDLSPGEYDSPAETNPEDGTESDESGSGTNEDITEEEQWGPLF